MNVRTSLLLLSASFSVAALCAAQSPVRAAESPIRADESETLSLRGVTAGVTTLAELEKNDRWGQQLSKDTMPDGWTWLKYRFWVWKKVTVLVYDGIVQTIDAFPPDPLPAEELVKTLKLGDLVPVESHKSLSIRAFAGSSTEQNWRIFRCSDAPGVLIFTEETREKQYAKLMRFYSLKKVVPIKDGPLGLQEYAEEMNKLRPYFDAHALDPD